MKKILAILVLAFTFGTVSNVALAGVAPFPQCYPCDSK